MTSILTKTYVESLTKMALKFKPIQISRPFAVISRDYCEKMEKTIYQREEEGAKPRTVYGKPYPEWRKPWIQRQGEWKSKFSVFIEKNPNPDILNAMSQIPDLTFDKVKEWWKSMKEKQEIHNQQYIPKRVTMLGSNLAAMHFFLYRQNAIR